MDHDPLCWAYGAVTVPIKHRRFKRQIRWMLVLDIVGYVISPQNHHISRCTGRHPGILPAPGFNEQFRTLSVDATEAEPW